MAQIGLKNFYYATCTVDDSDPDSVESYDTPTKIGHAVSVDINPEIQNISLYGDDMAVATDSSMKEVTVTIETTDIPISDLAVILGHDASGDGYTAKMTDSPPYVALLFESQKLDGGIRCVQLVKGKFSLTQETINTKGENMEYQVPKLTGKFVARKDGVWKVVKDYAKDSSTEDWYQSVVESSGSGGGLGG